MVRRGPRCWAMPNTGDGLAAAASQILCACIQAGLVVVFWQDYASDPHLFGFRPDCQSSHDDVRDCTGACFRRFCGQPIPAPASSCG